MTLEDSFPPARPRGSYRTLWLALAIPLALMFWTRWNPAPQAQTRPAGGAGAVDGAHALQPQEDQASAVPDRSAVPTPELREVNGIPATASQLPAQSPASETRRLLLGSWEDEFYGHRVFTFRDDGTATMTLELDSVGKALYGPKLTFFIAWTLKDDLLTLEMTGGEPAGTAVSLAKLFGDRSERKIERITDSEMHLRSLDSQTLYHHRRVSE